MRRAACLVVSDSFNPHRLKALLDRVELSLANLIIAWPVRDSVLIGPYLRRGYRPCHECLLGWLSSERTRKGDIGCLSLNNIKLLKDELRRWHKRPAVYAGRIKQVAVQARASSWHDVALRRDCPRCGQLSAHATGVNPYTLISPITGIVSSMSSVKMSGIWVAWAEVTQRGKSGPMVTSGLQVSRGGAERSCLFESIERHSLVYQGTEKGIIASAGELAASVASRALLYPFSDSQYAHRDQWNRRHAGMPYIPPKLPPGQLISWSSCWSLDAARAGWVPTQLVYLGASGEGSPCYYVSDSAGCAAAPAPAQAILNALLELIERDAVAIWWYNLIGRTAVNSATADPLQACWRRFLRSLGRSYCLFDITTDIDIPVFAGVSWDRRGKRPGLGFGCHPDPAIAAQRALRELCQTSIGAASDRAGRHPVWSAEHAFLRWTRDTCVFDHPHLRPSKAAREVEPREDLSAAPAETLLRLAVGTLRRLGLEAWVLPVTRPELGIPAMRVFCGELRHPGHRLAPGRLYDVPVKLGWIGKPRLEEELNPTPCIF